MGDAPRSVNTGRGVFVLNAFKIKGVCLGADRFAFGELLGKAPQVTKGACSWLGPTSSGSFTPVSLRGPAAIRHPWRGAALAASMPLGPLRETCVQPAPKSRFVSSGFTAQEDQKQRREQSKGESKAKASRLKPVLHPRSARLPLNARAAVSGTGFNREEARAGNVD